MSKNKAGKRPKLQQERFLGQINYFFGRAAINIRQNILVNLLTVGTISLSILIFSLLLLLYINLEKVTEQWSERVQVTVYFDNELPKQELKTLITRIQSLNGTGKITYVSKNEALQRFRERLRGQEALLDEVSAEILPASIEIRLKKDSRGGEALHNYTEKLRKIPGISEIQYGEEWVRRFNNFMDFMKLLGLFVGGFLVLAVIFIVANTIKLTIYSRKDELEILGLVGATRLFIKIPFIIEGIFQGAAGALLAIAVLYGLYYGFLNNSGSFLNFNPMDCDTIFLPVTYMAGILAGGILLGFLGSLTSLKRFITV
jgi:cell division transport system permease protein